MEKIKSYFKTHETEITLFVFSLAMTMFYFYSHGNISTDTGREAMIPMAILNGQVLYKDILNIYAPLGFYINAIFMAIFGIRLESLYIGGAISAIISLIMLYKISVSFLNKTISTILTLFVATSCFYNSTLFNYIMPYSYSVTYALCFIFSTVYCLIKFCEKKECKFLYISAILSGCAFACKVEYSGICLITLFVSYWILRDIKTSAKVLATICVIPFISYAIPFMQGLTIPEAINAFEIFSKEAVAPSMINFSKLVGTVFTPSDFMSWITGIIYFAIFVGLAGLLLTFTKNKMMTLITLFVLSVIHYFLQGEIHFSFLPVLMTIYFIINFKKLLQKPTKFILISAAILSSLKTFFRTDLLLYGSFTLPLLLIAMIVVVLDDYSKVIEQKLKFPLFNGQSTIALIVFLLAAGGISNFYYNIEKKEIYSFPIKTERGRIDTENVWQKQSVKLLDFIEKNTKEEDKILFLPEGCMFNFLSKRPTDMKMYVLDIPFVETLGEDRIVDGLSQYKYIVLLEGFGLGGFGKPDYYKQSNKITNFIKDNYKIIFIEQDIGTEILFFERNNKQ